MEKINEIKGITSPADLEVRFLAPNQFENYLMENFTYDTYEIIDALEKEYHQRKFLMDTKGLSDYKRNKIITNAQNKYIEAIMAGKDPKVR